MTHPIRRPATPTHPITLTTLMLTALLLTSCTPPTPTTPTPSTPKYDHTCHTEDQQTEYPCTTEQHQQMLHQDALYTEAEDVYRRHMTEVLRIGAHWELSEVTPEIEATAAGPYLETMTRLFSSERADRVTRVSGEPTIQWIKRYPDRSMGGSIVALWACVDGTNSIYTTASVPKETPGIATEAWVYLLRDDDALKVWEAEAKTVQTC